MAIDASTVWEFRPGTGSNDNGGGFASAVASAVGTDYSQQASCVIEISDFKMAAAGTFASSATGTFTSAMTGNVFYLRGGTNFTSGFYCITSWTASTNVDIDRNAVTGSAAATSGTISVGGARAVWTTVCVGSSAVAGNTIWVKDDGDMTLTAAVATVDGTLTSPVIINGYNTTRGDTPTGTNRPTIAAGANAITFGVAHKINNLIGTGTSTSVFGVISAGSQGTHFYNCKASNTSGTALRVCFGGQTSLGVERCEANSTNGNAFNGAFSAIYCYAHDSTTGFANTGRSGVVANCLVYNCTNGITNADQSGHSINNVIYKCSVGISANIINQRVYNTIIASCTTGISYGISSMNKLDYNCWNNNTTDISGTGLEKGSNDITSDPLLNNPTGADYTLQSGSPCLSAGFSDYTLVGAVGDYKINIGVDQDDNTATGTGGGQVGRVYAY